MDIDHPLSKMDISRREFIRLAGVTLAGTCLCGLGMSGCTASGISDTPAAPPGSFRLEGRKMVISLMDVDVLEEAGGAAKFSLSDSAGSELKLIVIHTPDESYLAFRDKCTHKGKELNYLPADGILGCSGLSSQFDLEGKVMRGPAEENLTGFSLWREGQELVIELEEGSET